MENALRDLTVTATRTTVADLVTSLAKPNMQSSACPAGSPAALFFPTTYQMQYILVN